MIQNPQGISGFAFVSIAYKTLDGFPQQSHICHLPVSAYFSLVAVYRATRICPMRLFFLPVFGATKEYNAIRYNQESYLTFRLLPIYRQANPPVAPPPQKSAQWQPHRAILKKYSSTYPAVSLLFYYRLAKSANPHYCHCSQLCR